MAFPSGATLTTTNLDSSADDPSLARADLLDLMNKVQDIIDSENSADGVVVLDSSGNLASSVIPSTWTPSTLTLQPLDGIVNINDFIKLNPVTKTELLTYVSFLPQGTVAFCSDAGGASTPGICFHDGTNFKFITLSSMTTLS